MTKKHLQLIAWFLVGFTGMLLLTSCDKETWEERMERCDCPNIEVRVTTENPNDGPNRLDLSSDTGWIVTPGTTPKNWDCMYHPDNVSSRSTGYTLTKTYYRCRY